jgi:adenylate cyclase
VLVAGANGVGALDAQPDADGVARRVGVQFAYNGHAFDSLASRTVQEVLGEPISWVGHGGSFAGRTAVSAGHEIPVNEDGRMLLLWHGGSAVYPRIPIWQVICSIYPTQCPPDTKHYPPSFFAGKIVLIGASATASYDVHPTPFANAAPGVVVHATAIDDLLNGAAIREAPGWVLAELIVAMAVAGGILFFLMRQLALALTVMFSVAGLYASACLLLYSHAHLALHYHRAPIAPDARHARPVHGAPVGGIRDDQFRRPATER